MLLRIGKPKEAQAAAAPFPGGEPPARSRYRGLGLYYHGFASFQLGEALAAGKSLGRLTPFDDPVFGTHARYLLARVHHESGERQEAQLHYDAVIADHAKQKQAAAAALGQPDRWKNDPDEKARLERLANGPAPDHVARATFFLGVLLYEDSRFGEALGRFQAFGQQFPTSPLALEAQLRQGFCQVQQKQFDDALKTLQPLVDKEPRLNDQALYWMAKAQVGKADPANAQAYEQAIKAALDTFRRAADRAGQLVASDPRAKLRRGEMLVDLADTMQLIKQYKDAAAVYNQVLNEKLLPPREEEIFHSLATALQLAGDYAESDKTCLRFRDTYPKSTLLPALLFRHAENAYFQALAAEKIADVNARKNEMTRLNDEALKRYQVVVDKYPEYQHANLARFGVAMAHYRKGDLEKARPALEAIPPAERNGDLALVSYYLADLLIRTAPAKADDAVAAGKLEEQLKAAVEQLDSFAGAAPNGAETADALLKLGYCHQRLAGLMAMQPDKDKALGSARAAYEALMQRFTKGPEYPIAIFERAKVLALARDPNGAMNELRRFLNDPLKAAPVAPMACLHLATLLRADNKPADAAAALDQCRKEHEAKLAADPTRAPWAHLLRYHHGVALREAGKRPEARTVLEQVVQQAADRPEGAESALRAGQCLKEEAQMKVAEGQKKLGTPGLKPEDQAAAQRLIDQGAADLRAAAQYLANQAETIRQKQPNHEARARILYEAAWAAREVAALEIEAAREKLRQELWQKQKDELAKKTPAGRQPPHVPLPEVTLKMVPPQPAEALARGHYQALITAFPDVAVNADARFELAELHSERGEHDAAIKLLKEALDKEPGAELTDRIRVRLGAALLAKGDAKAAIAQLSPVAGNPKSALAAQATYRAGEASLQMNDPGEAVKRLALFRDKGEFQNLPGLTDRALLRLGHALGLLKQWEPSRQAYEQVVSRFGNGAWANDARYGMAWALQNMERFDDAVNWYSQAAANVATELGARAQMNIGLCRLAQKRYPEASTALLVVPFTYDYPHLSALSLVEAARAFSENKQDEQAIRLLERVLRDHPDTEQAEAARKRLAQLKKG